MHNLRTDSLYFFASYTLWSKLYHETFVGHEGLAMGFLVVAISKSKVIDFVAAVADTFGKGDVSVLDQSVEFFIVELVKLVKRFDCLIIDDFSGVQLQPRVLKIPKVRMRPSPKPRP
ncbi:MAG: hypothetical protein RL440_875 [Bacteroidota bacterium]